MIVKELKDIINKMNGEELLYEIKVCIEKTTLEGGELIGLEYENNLSEITMSKEKQEIILYGVD